MMLKKFFVFLAIALAVLLVFCWIYLPSVSRYRELKSEEEKLSKRIMEIDRQIKVLAEERNLLQRDITYLEKVIREELGFVKPGEIVYELITKKNVPNAKTGATIQSSSPAGGTAKVTSEALKGPKAISTKTIKSDAPASKGKSPLPSR